MVVAHAIAQVSGDRRGIHVLFSGPPAWLYAPGGFTIERRLWQRPKGRRLCAELRDSARSSTESENWKLPSGSRPCVTEPGSTHLAVRRTAEVLTVRLREPTPMATVAMPGPNWTAYGLQNGRVVAAGPAQTAPGQLILTAPAIDCVVVHAQHADGWQICAFVNIEQGGGWSNVAMFSSLSARPIPRSRTNRANGSARAAGCSPVSILTNQSS